MMHGACTQPYYWLPALISGSNVDWEISAPEMFACTFIIDKFTVYWETVFIWIEAVPQIVLYFYKFGTSNYSYLVVTSFSVAILEWEKGKVLYRQLENSVYNLLTFRLDALVILRAKVYTKFASCLQKNLSLFSLFVSHLPNYCPILARVIRCVHYKWVDFACVAGRLYFFF